MPDKLRPNIPYLELLNAATNLLRHAGFDDEVVVALGRVSLSCACASETVLMKAMLLHWDMCPADDKVALIGKASVSSWDMLEDNTLFDPVGQEGGDHG